MTTTTAKTIEPAAKAIKKTASHRPAKAKRSGPAKNVVTRTTGPKPKREMNADTIIRMLTRDGGASIAELIAEMGIQPHTIRALISTTKRARGLTVELKEGRYRAA